MQSRNQDGWQRGVRRRVALVALAAITTASICGCSRREKSSDAANANAVIAEHMPRYDFAEGLREAHPELTDFLQAFFETCLTGDYEGYRKYVSRRQQPEPRDRFERIYDAIELLTVKEIREVPIPQLPAPTYLIITSVEFLEGKLPVFGEDRRAIAILVFPEEGEWRMVPAPSELQPQRRTNRATATSSAPAEDAAPVVEYPWEDYSGG